MNTCTGRDALRRSNRCTLWSAQPTATSCADAGLYLAQHTLARRSMAATAAGCVVDHTCAAARPGDGPEQPRTLAA